MEIKKALEGLYSAYKDEKKVHKSEVLFLIIQIKADHRDLEDIEQSLYLDIKSFIKYYISSIEKKDYGYDKLETRKLKSAIEYLQDFKEKYELCLFSLRLIGLKGHEIELSKFVRYRNDCKTSYLKSKKTLSAYLKLIQHLTSYDLKSILLSVLLIFILSNIIFLPSRFEVFELFEMSYKDYADNFFINHVLNILSAAFGIEDDKIVKPLNGGGVILLSILKSLYILIFLNYLYQKIINILYAN